MEQTKYIETPHSVEISINQKGAFSGTVKCYGQTPEEAMTQACNLAMQLETIIKEKNSKEAKVE